MASPDENYLAENGVVRSGDDFLCFSCSRRGDPSTNWRSHIAEKRHAEAWQKFRTFFAADSVAELINCRACDTRVSYDSFVEHAKWHRIAPWHRIGDRYKAFFENRILNVPASASYACLPCKMKFVDWSSALSHVAEESHREAASYEPPMHEGFEPRPTSYEFLIHEGFEPWSVNSVKCRHCNRPNVGVTSVREHAAETSHAEAKKTFALSFAASSSSSRRDEEIEPPSNRYGATEQPSHRAEANSSSYKGANGDARSRKRTPAAAAAAEVRHSSVPPRRDATPRHPLKAKWEPRRSDSSASTNRRSFPVERRGDQSYCSVCEARVDTEAQVHEKEESHLKKLETLGYAEIEPVDGWTYKCKCCDCKVANLENVFRHIKGMKHRQILASSRNEKAQARGNTISFKMNFPAANNSFNAPRYPSPLNRNVPPFNFPAAPNVLPPLMNFLPSFPPPRQVAPSAQSVGLTALTRSTWEILPRDYIVVQNSKDLFCRICDCVIYGHGHVDEHMRSKGHAEGVEDFCANVSVLPDNSYRCKKCNVDVASRNELYIHLVSHAATKKKEETAQTSCQNGETSQRKEETSSPKGEPSSSKGETSSAKRIDEPAPRSNNDRIVILNRQDYCCKVCYLLLIDDETKIEEHLASAKHADALRLEVKFRYKDDGKYYCNYCRCTIPNFANVPLHAIGERHKRALPGAGATNGNTLPRDWRELSLYYIAANGDDSYYCRICNLAIFSRREITEHLASELHRRKYEEYGCSEIRMMGNNQFNCSWCDCVMPHSDHIYVHVSGKRHLDSVASGRRKITAKPEIGAMQPEMGAKQPEMGVKPPEMGAKPPEMGAKPPEMGAKPPEMGAKPPEMGATPPEMGATPPEMGATPPEMGATPPEMGATPPEMGAKPWETAATPPQTSAKPPEAFAKPQEAKMADQSPSEDYERMIALMMNNDVKELEDSSSKERPLSANRETSSPSNVRSLASSTLSLNELGIRKQRTPKLLKDPKVSAINDEDLAGIHDTRDRARHAVESRSFLTLDENSSLYCIVCKQTIGQLPAVNHDEHIWSAVHCANFEMMLEGEAKFAATPEQFSDLRLARDYLEETLDETIKCHVCEIELENVETEISDHIGEKTHGKKRVAQRARVANALEQTSVQREIDWYNVRSYKCVPCSVIFDSEIPFARHLKSPEHAEETKLQESSGRLILNDYCHACCQLSHGYLVTRDEHCRTDEHLRRTVLGNDAIVAKLPTAAKHYLLLPDRSVDRYEKLFEEKNTKRATSEANFVRDLEYCCGPDSKAIQVWAFQSKPEAAEHEEIVEYEVYFDLEKLSDRKDASEKSVSRVMSHVELCLLQESALWRKDESSPGVVSSSSSSRLTMRHLPSDTRCTLLFDAPSELDVEKLYQFVMLKFPIVAKLMGFLRPWFRISELLGTQRFTVIDLFCYVILYLQSESLFPKISDLTDRNGSFHLKPEADMTILELETNLAASRRDLRQLLAGFFRYYAKFDYRRDVACPRNGSTIPKSAYTANYTDEKLSQFHTAACIENPFDSVNNLVARVEKLYVKNLREYCAESLLILEKTSNQS